MPRLNPQVLNDIALEILDDEGQVKVSVLVDDGKVREAKLLLFREIAVQSEAGRLDAADSHELVERLGFTPYEQRQLRTGELV